MSALRGLWRTDVETISAAERRLALYALQLLDGVPGLRARLRDSDFLGALWHLLLPVMRPQAVAAFLARHDETGAADEDDWQLSGAPFSEQDTELLSLPSERRLRERLRAAFGGVPRRVLKRLQAADDLAPLSATVALLGAHLGLDAPALRVLDFLDRYILVEPLRMLLRECPRAPARINHRRLAALLGLTGNLLRETLGRRAPLRSLGLVVYDEDLADLEDFLRPGDLLRRVLETAPTDGAALLDLLIEPAPVAHWRLADFPHLASAAERLAGALGESARGGVPGVNALLYGEPGTGKTELARAVAAAAGLSAFQVRSADEDDDVLGGHGRLSAYLMAQRLLGRRRDAVLIFDEVEDVFEYQDDIRSLLRGGPVTGSQKGWMNRILEDNRVPAIWITNDTDGMDPAFLRRFLLPVACVTPPHRVRRQMAERHLGDLGLGPELLDTLAADPKLAPAQLGAARRLVELRPGVAPERTVREGIAALRTLLHGAPAPQRREPATAFDEDYLNVSGGLAPDTLLQALRRTGHGRLCFYGPPGTGKTAFAEVLAERLGRELLAHQASDLLSPYVGETEYRLAQLFRDCDPAHSVLMLDEVDSFLADRRQARQVWERTQVNELLQQMERFPGVFIAATNLMSGIDPAALRRFDFKLQFQALTPGQCRALFAREALGAATADVPEFFAHRLQRLEGLVPGDFATVCRQQRLIGERFSPEQFLNHLTEEWRCKTQDDPQVA